MLRIHTVEAHAKTLEFAVRLVAQCREKLSAVSPFTDSERTLLDQLSNHEVVDSTILTGDASLPHRIPSLPLLEWKALNVRHYKGFVGPRE